mgnify:CR=1 FL=1
MIKKILCGLLALAMCGCLFGCGKDTTQEPELSIPANNTPIIPQVNEPTVAPLQYTPVYASAFGDTILLATVPVDEWHAQERDCEPREISHGGRVKCNGEHEQEVPITKVVILEDIIPRNCSGWFRDMIHLEKIEGLDKLKTHEVTDMSFMFAGCEDLKALDTSTWDVSQVKDMTAMFENCFAMSQLPTWYGATPDEA